MIDPIELSIQVRNQVSKNDKRKYYRFRKTRFYGGCATADCLGCNLRCAYCWGQKKVWNPNKYGEFYYPMDVSVIASRAIREIDPVLYIMMETELWPNLISKLCAKNIPVVLVNGRISDASFGNYRKILFLMRFITAKIDKCCMQSSRDAERMTEPRSFQRIFEGAMLRWASGQYDAEGVETWDAFSSRVRAAVSQIMAENGRRKKIAVFTSGGPICATIQMAIGVDAQVAVRLNWQIRNTSVSRFKYNDQEIFLGSFNSVHHLESRNKPDLLTYR